MNHSQCQISKADQMEHYFVLFCHSSLRVINRGFGIIIILMKDGMAARQKQETREKTNYKSLILLCSVSLNISLSFFYFGYTTIYYSCIPTETIHRIYRIQLEQSYAQGILNGAISIGALIGSISSHLLINHFSRWKCQIIVNIATLIVSLLIFIPNFYTFLLLRGLQGVCIGVISNIGSLYIKQFSPLRVSGILGTFPQFSQGFSVTFIYTLNYVLNKITGDESGQSYWVIVYGFTIITQAIQLALLIFAFPYETPKYLLLQGKVTECYELLHVIYEADSVEAVYRQKQNDIKYEAEQKEKSPQNNTLILPLIVSCVLMSFRQFSGVNVATVYARQLATAIFSGEITKIIPILLNLVVLLATLVSFLVVPHFGRKTIIGCGFAMAFVTAFWVATQYGNTSWPVVIGLLLFMTNYGLTLGPAVWFYIPEVISPSKIPLAVTCSWVAYTIVIMLFPIAKQHLFGGSPKIQFYIFSIFSLTAFIFVMVFMVETKDKTEKEIKEEYARLRIGDSE